MWTPTPVMLCCNVPPTQGSHALELNNPSLAPADSGLDTADHCCQHVEATLADKGPTLALSPQLAALCLPLGRIHHHAAAASAAHPRIKASHPRALPPADWMPLSGPAPRDITPPRTTTWSCSRIPLYGISKASDHYLGSPGQNVETAIGHAAK
jgi:hypothetical protein